MKCMCNACYPSYCYLVQCSSCGWLLYWGTNSPYHSHSTCYLLKVCCYISNISLLHYQSAFRTEIWQNYHLHKMPETISMKVFLTISILHYLKTSNFFHASSLFFFACSHFVFYLFLFSFIINNGKWFVILCVPVIT